MATRKASEEVLKELTKVIPEMVGGSADLTGSNNTKVEAHKPITPDDFSGGYVYWGVREHGMASAMNGMALHGGFIPFGGHLSGVHRLLPPGHPPVGSDAAAGHLRHDP